jgi:hypothetical protein
MSLNDRARIDAQNFIGNANDFGVACVLKTPDESVAIDVVGWHTKHHMSFDPDGVMVNTKTASLAIPEQQLIDAGFPNIRNADGDIALKGSLIDAPDSTGVVKKYVTHQIFPDEYLGLLVFILGDYKAN